MRYPPLRCAMFEPGAWGVGGCAVRCLAADGVQRVYVSIDGRLGWKHAASASLHRVSLACTVLGRRSWGLRHCDCGCGCACIIARLLLGRRRLRARAARARSHTHSPCARAMLRCGAELWVVAIGSAGTGLGREGGACTDGTSERHVGGEEERKDIHMTSHLLGAGSGFSFVVPRSVSPSMSSKTFAVLRGAP